MGDLEQLNFVSGLIGNSRNLVQGPGGNTSVKIGNRIFVKGSGKHLDRAATENVFCEIEFDSTDSIKNLVISQEIRPSIETEFHIRIPSKFVFHVHSVGSLTWGIREVDEVFKKLMSTLNLGWIYYAKPGSVLADQIINSPDIDKFDGVLLRNHGLIVWGSDAWETYKKLQNIELTLMEAAILYKSEENGTYSLESIGNGVAFTPDHAVFLSQVWNASRDDGWVFEMRNCINSALKLIPTHLDVSTLSNQEIDELVGWEAEIFRRESN